MCNTSKRGRAGLKATTIWTHSKIKTNKTFVEPQSWLVYIYLLSFTMYGYASYYVFWISCCHAPWTKLTFAARKGLKRWFDLAISANVEKTRILRVRFRILQTHCNRHTVWGSFFQGRRGECFSDQMMILYLDFGKTYTGQPWYV